MSFRPCLLSLLWWSQSVGKVETGGTKTILAFPVPTKQTQTLSSGCLIPPLQEVVSLGTLEVVRKPL